MCRICTVLPFSLLLLLFAAGCNKDPLPPGKTIQAFLDQVKEGKIDEAITILDMDAKAASLFGELYTAADAQDKERTQEILTQRLKDSLLQESEALSKLKEGPSIHGKIMDEGRRTAEVRVQHSDIVFIYSMEFRDDWKGQGATWVIVDRTHEKNGIRSSTTMGVKSLMNMAERTHGRKPTLAELNELLPEGMGAIKVHGFRVGAPTPSSGAASPSPSPTPTPAP